MCEYNKVKYTMLSISGLSDLVLKFFTVLGILSYRSVFKKDVNLAGA